MIEVHRLHLTDVTPAPNLPWTRPAFPVFAYLVLHPTGSILVDTGVGIGNRLIDELYSPVHHDIDYALGRHGVGIDDVATVITSHLHFDHCGRYNRFASSTILVQRAEVEAATAARYTVPDWAFPQGLISPSSTATTRWRGTCRSSRLQDTPPGTSQFSSRAATGCESSCAARQPGM